MIEKHVIEGAIRCLRIEEIFSEKTEESDRAQETLRLLIDMTLQSIYPDSYCVDLIPKGGTLSSDSPAYIALIMTHSKKVQEYAESVEKVIDAISACLSKLVPNTRTKIQAEIFVKSSHHVGNS